MINEIPAFHAIDFQIYEQLNCVSWRWSINSADNVNDELSTSFRTPLRLEKVFVEVFLNMNMLLNNKQFQGQIFVNEQLNFGVFFIVSRQFTSIGNFGENFWKIKRKSLKFFLNNFYVPKRQYLCVLLCSNYADIYGKCVITFIHICIEYKVSLLTCFAAS